MPATDYHRRQAVIVSAGGHALRERARTDSDSVQIRELRGTERVRMLAGGPSGIRELRERFESILSELAELRAHRGDAERAELELRNELETTRAQLSKAVTQLGTTRDQLTAARADADAARTDAAASAARAQRFEERLAETMASAARAEHVEVELAQAVVRAERAEAQVEIALRARLEPGAPVVQQPIAAEPAVREPVVRQPVQEPIVEEPTARVPAVASQPSTLEQIAAEVPPMAVEPDVDDTEPGEPGVDDAFAQITAMQIPAPVPSAPAPEIVAPVNDPVTPAAAVPTSDPASGAPAPFAPQAFPGTEEPSEGTPKTRCAPRSSENFDECMAELRQLNAGSEDPSTDGRWGVGGS